MDIFGYIYGLYASNEMGVLQFRVYQLKRSWAPDRHLYWSFSGYCSRKDIEREKFIRLPDNFEYRHDYSFREGDLG